MKLSNIQEVNARLRKKYGEYSEPLLEQLAKLHGLTVSDFASVFSIDGVLAADLLSHRVLPDYPLAVRIARYFDLDTDTLFGWRVDDTGERSPLIVQIPGVKGRVKLNVLKGMSRVELLEKIQKAKRFGQTGMDRLAMELEEKS